MLFLFKIKVLLIKNTLKTILKDHSLLKLIFIGTLSTLLLITSFFIIYKFFSFVKVFPFSDLLIHRSLSLFFLVIFSMLIFSVLITSLSLLYKSSEKSFLMGLPIKSSAIFKIKFAESVVLSSWAALLLCLPILVAWQISTSCSPLVYLVALFSLSFFIIICGTIGTAISLLLSSIFSLRRSHALFMGLVFLLLPFVVFVAKFGIFKETPQEAFAFFGKIIDSMGFSTHPLLPSVWFVQGIDGIRKGEWPESLFLLSLMGTTAITFYIFLSKMADSLYLRGIDLMEGSSSSSKYKEVFWIRKILFFLKPGFKALIIKDILLFLRDPLQWSQFLIFFGILFVYIPNLPLSGYEIDLPYFKSLTFFLNISAIALVVSTLTTRFIFPLISLEGKRFWIIGLSPITKKGLLLEKLFLSSFPFLLITEGLMVLLNLILKTEGLAFFLSLVMIGIMTLTLTSLSVGLGAVYPVFSKEDPSSIVSSFGGTINAIISLLYVIFSVALVAIPVQLYILHKFPYQQLVLYLIASISVFIVVSLFCSLVPMIKGIRSLEGVET
ncbi:hypothetical protein KJ640_08105 [bacterium]|nr:hypothetical protein [bacterium]